ncbi:MAG: hypothetical protein D0530_11210 [Methylococcales bacterium]|nr:MAG: hypothetical protein D0530_11210 [Methylococcales bacterium]
MKLTHDIPKSLLNVLNQLYELEQKIKRHGDSANLERNITRMKSAFEELSSESGLFYEDPMGQPFKETRTDVDATISGTSTENLFVVEVIKPIIRVGNRKYNQVVQKGIVVVESK